MTTNNTEEIDQYSFMDRTEKAYPYILLENAPDELIDVIEALDTGTLPIHVPSGGYEIELDKHIANTLECINKLLKILPLTFVVSENKAYKITKVEQLIDLEDYQWT